MPLSDRQIRRQIETRTAIITEINIPSNAITVRDQFGTTLSISMNFTNGIISVPQIGEAWTIQRKNSDWYLASKQTSSDEYAKGYSGLLPGDKRIEAPGDLYLDASEIKINGVTLDPNVPVQKNGTIVATRHGLNIVEGTNLSVSVTDDAANDQVVITPALKDVVTLTSAGHIDIGTNRQPKFTNGAISSGPPTSPTTGDIWIANSVGVNNERWSFQYNASSSSTYKWEFIGGSPVRANEDNSVNTGATSFSGVGLGSLPTFTVPRSGRYEVAYGGSTYNTNSNQTNFTVLVKNGSPVTTTGIGCIVANYTFALAHRPVQLDLAQGDTLFLSHYATNPTGFWQERYFHLTPTRII